jgi:hypothetical protein
MADYAPNYTGRYRVRYHGGGLNHSMSFRTVSGSPTDNAGVLVDVQAFLDALAGDMFDDWFVISTAAAIVDTDVFLPVTGPVVSGGGPVFAGSPPKYKAGSISFTGRTTSGLRAIVYVYGTDYVIDGATPGFDLRVYSTEDTGISNAVAALNGAGFIVGNDGQQIVWNPYANVKTNDYWGKKVRQGL